VLPVFGIIYAKNSYSSILASVPVIAVESPTATFQLNDFLSNIVVRLSLATELLVFSFLTKTMKVL
jgi:hypothetical protein